MDPKSELKLIEDILSKINSKMTSEELISYALTKICSVYDFLSCGIITYDKMTGDLRVKISKGLSHQFVKTFHEKKTKGIIEEVLKNEMALLINKDHPHYNKEEFRFEHDYEVLYVTPLRIGGEVIGAIYFDSTNKDMFSESDLNFLSDFANICALVIDHTNLLDYIVKTSDHDSLTGLYSYKYFHEALDREMMHAKRADYPVALFLASIGHLGDYNSVFGHIAGDQAVITTANIIKECIRSNDIPARYGNKFIIIFPESDAQGVSQLAERICKRMDDEAFKGKAPKPTLRIGIASFPRDGMEEQELITHAERNLFEAKRRGGNSYVY